MSNVWEKSTFQIQQYYPAPVGFLPEPDFCRIWKRAGFRPEIRPEQEPKKNHSSPCHNL